MTNGITSATTHELWVCPREGAEIAVTDAYKGAARFTDELDKTFTRVRLPQDSDRLKAGERVDFFGPTSIPPVSGTSTTGSAGARSTGSR
ncbi:hypothetical protein [Streptomyces sp. NPDC088146]|uniref:hypothetical protein n=1 Tax=unclassified Streptomyces TaxID=2593676 RepID=UPI00382ABDC1